MTADDRDQLATVHVLVAPTAAARDAHLRFDALIQAALRRYAKEWATGEHPAEETP
jgi:hypothetical protein